jgi:hypothetical protein
MSSGRRKWKRSMKKMGLRVGRDRLGIRRMKLLGNISNNRWGKRMKLISNNRWGKRIKLIRWRIIRILNRT